MVSILRWFATDWFDFACVDVEFESSYWSLHAVLCKHVDELGDDVRYNLFLLFGTVSPLEVFLDFVVVCFMVVSYNIVAGWEHLFVFDYDFPVVLE